MDASERNVGLELVDLERGLGDAISDCLWGYLESQSSAVLRLVLADQDPQWTNSTPYMYRKRQSLKSALGMKQ